MFRFMRRSVTNLSKSAGQARRIPAARAMLIIETMVDSRKDMSMRDRIDDLAGRVRGVERKIDQLSTRVVDLSASVDRRFNQVDQRFEQIDRRFDAMEAGLVEQREYTEFAYSHLDAKMDAGFARLDAKMDAGFARLDAKMEAGFGQLERKLDQFIDVQLQTNGIADRRLSRLESPSASGATS
jgi:hypothetical protein